MKKLLNALLICTVTFSSLFALSHEEFQQKFKIINTNNPGLINSSEGKDIVVFMDATGAGKSTTLNFLNDIPMTVNPLTKKFINSESPNSFKIGEGDLSQTLIPKYIENTRTQLLMYDFAGWSDNREAIDNLVGAAFIKKIIESAKSVKIVFVTSEPTIEAQRGELVKIFLNTASKVFKNTDLKSTSIIIVTQADVTASEAKWEYIQQTLPSLISDSTLLGTWKEPSILPFSKALTDEKQKLIILETIEKFLTKSPIKEIDISHIYNGNIQKELGDLFAFELKAIAESVLTQFGKLPTTNIIQIGQAQEYINNFKTLFVKKLKDSKVIELFAPLSKKTYEEKLQAQLNQLHQTATQKTEVLLKQKQAIEIEEKAKKELAERKLAEEKRIAEIKHQEEIKRLQQAKEAEEKRLKDIANMQNSLNGVLNELKSVKTSSTDQAKKLETQIGDLQKQLIAMEKDKNSKEDAIAKMSSQMKTLQTEIEKLKKNPPMRPKPQPNPPKGKDSVDQQVINTLTFGGGDKCEIF